MISLQSYKYFIIFYNTSRIVVIMACLVVKVREISLRQKLSLEVLGVLFPRMLGELRAKSL